MEVPLDTPVRQPGSDTPHERPTASQQSRRAMVRAELLGQHRHRAQCGVRIQVWQRQGSYLARGRYQGDAFGVTLGSNPQDAAAQLRRLLVEIEDGVFVRPSELGRRPLQRSKVPRLNLRQLCDNFLAEKRQVVGQQTSDNYADRLVPVIEFAEQPDSRKRWPMAADMNRGFAIALKAHLHARTVTANGHPATVEKRMSPGHIYNVLDCARSMLNWAKRPDVNQLPSYFVSPLTAEIVGHRPRKDPLRAVKFPIETRIELVCLMDAWQLSHLGILLVLPLRPEDVAGLLISEIDFESGLLRFGTRLGGRDFNKGRQEFSVPFPPQLASLLMYCAEGRQAGPLLRCRSVFHSRSRPILPVECASDVSGHLERALAAAPSGTVLTEQDQKGFFRRLLLKMGGVSVDALSKEFKTVLSRASQPATSRFYDLRGSVTTDLDRAGVSHLVQRYVTGHTTNDILNEYVSLDPVLEMQKHFQYIGPLLDAITERSRALGITE